MTGSGPISATVAALPETPVPFAAKSEGRARCGPGEAGASDGFRRPSSMSESAHLYLNSNFLFPPWGQSGGPQAVSGSQEPTRRKRFEDEGQNPSKLVVGGRGSM